MTSTAEKDLRRFISMANAGHKMITAHKSDFTSKGLSMAMEQLLEENEKLKSIIGLTECGSCGVIKIMLKNGK